MLAQIIERAAKLKASRGALTKDTKVTKDTEVTKKKAGGGVRESKVKTAGKPIRKK